ncbi:hypothetical protein D3C81_957850 [compost metagenome]
MVYRALHEESRCTDQMQGTAWVNQNSVELIERHPRRRWWYVGLTGANTGAEEPRHAVMFVGYFVRQRVRFIEDNYLPLYAGLIEHHQYRIKLSCLSGFVYHP